MHLRSLIATLVFVVSVVEPARAANTVPPELKDVGITEKLGNSLSLDTFAFKDETGAEVKLSQFFGKKPVILTLVYYGCPNLCNYLLNGLVDSMKPLAWTPGKEFDIVTVSIDPTENAKLAQAKKTSYLESYGRPSAAFGWHFLTGSEDQIKKLAGEVGFGYRYDDQEKQYAHSAAIFVLTPQGKISRYLYGIQWAEKDLRLALLEASSGKIGTIVDRLLLFCYRYDPHTRKYSIYLTKVMQAGSAGTILVFGGYLAVFWRRQRERVGKVDSRET